MYQLLKSSQGESDGGSELLRCWAQTVSLIACFTPQVSKELPALSAVGKTTVFLGSETGESEDLGDLMCYSFLRRIIRTSCGM